MDIWGYMQMYDGYNWMHDGFMYEGNTGAYVDV